MNVLTCSTPEWLARGTMDDSVEGGFLGRFVLPTNTSLKSIKLQALPQLNNSLLDLRYSLIHDLQHIAKIRGLFTLDEDVQVAYKSWFEAGEYLNKHVIDKGFFARKPVHLLKVAGLLSVAESDDLVVKMPHFEAAMRILDDVEEHVGYALLYIGATDEMRIGQYVIDLLESGEKTYNEILHNVRKYLKSVNHLNTILDLLMASFLIVKSVKNNKTYYELTEHRRARIQEAIKMKMEAESS